MAPEQAQFACLPLCFTVVNPVDYIGRDNETAECHNDKVAVCEHNPVHWSEQTGSSLFSTSLLHQVIEENKAVKKDKWVKDNQGQLIITAGQVVWTTECEKALADPDEAKAALRHLKKKWISYLNKLTAITCSKLNKIERNKV